MTRQDAGDLSWEDGSTRDRWAETGKWWEDAAAAEARRTRPADDIPPDDPDPLEDADQLPLLDVDEYQAEIRRLNEERMRRHIEGGD